MQYYKFFRSFLYKFDPELAHDVAIWLLKKNLIPFNKTENYENLSINLWGNNFLSPIGLAAGFDKNAECIKSLLNMQFGFIELGTVTPMPQAGNSKPRMFRLIKEESIINRLGFNNKGSNYFLNNLQTFGNKEHFIGINIGKNKYTETAVNDYIILLKKFYSYASYITINISSPNTPDLRQLQYKLEFSNFIKELVEVKEELSLAYQRKVPLLVKVAPDVDDATIDNIVAVAIENKIDGLIVSNTTTSRENINDRLGKEAGGLSGKALFEKSTRILAKFYKISQGGIPLVGVGGISSGYDAYQKILHGASLIQIYSSIIYRGFGVVNKIKSELSELISQDGFNNVTEAIGKKVI